MKIINEKSYNHSKICCSDAIFEEEYPQIFAEDDRDEEKRRTVGSIHIETFIRGLVLEALLVFCALQNQPVEKNLYMTYGRMWIYYYLMEPI